MSRITLKYRAFLRIIAMLVVCLFLVDSVSWAQAGISAPSNALKSDLQVQSIFNPVIKAAGWERAAQIKLEIACIMKMALDEEPMPFQDINAEIDKWLSAAGTHPRFRALDVMSTPREENGRRIVEFCVFGGPDSGRIFRLTMDRATMEEIGENPDKVTLEMLDTPQDMREEPAALTALDDPVVEKVKDILGADLKGRRVLEIGIGRRTDHIEQLIKAGAFVTAVDNDDAALKAVRERIGVEGVTLKTMDFNQMFTFPDGEFDAVIFTNILDYVFVWGMPEGASPLDKGLAVAGVRVNFFKECARVLKPNGIVVSADVADLEYVIRDPGLRAAVTLFNEIIDIGKAGESAGLKLVERDRSFDDRIMVFRKPRLRGMSQIGKRARVVSVDTVKNVAIVELVDGARHELPIVHDGVVDVEGLEQYFDSMNFISPEHREVISEMLKFVRNARPENYVFETLIDDLAGFAWPRSGIIAMHQAMNGDPVAVFHEIGEYLAKTGGLKIKKDGDRVLLTLYGGDTINVELSGRTRATIDEEGWGSDWQNDPHYLLRALQIEMFGSLDTAVSRKLGLMQRLGGSAIKLWTFTSADVDDILNLSPFAVPEKLKEKVDKLLPGAFPDAPVEGVRKIEHLIVPARIDGKYETMSLLGAGGMGIVVKARVAGAGDVAIKIMEVPESPGARLYLLQEYFIWQEAQRVEGVIKLYDAGSFVMGGIRYCFIVQELADGGELVDGMLAKRVDELFDHLESGTLVRDEAASVTAREDEAYSIAEQLLTIAKGLHSRGIIHADITPRNIFRFKQGDRIKIGDLGVSSYVPRGETKKSKGGTLDYQSAETIWSGKYSFKTDLFAIGCDLYEIVHGEPFYLFPETLEGGIFMDAPLMLEKLRERAEKIRKLRDDPADPMDRVIAALLTENVEVNLRPDGARMIARIDRGGVESAVKALDILADMKMRPGIMPPKPSGEPVIKSRKAPFDEGLAQPSGKTTVRPRKLKFEDTGRLMVNTALDKLLGQKLAGQVQLIEREKGDIFINRRPSLIRNANGEIVNDIMGAMWDGITVKPEHKLSTEFLEVVQKTYYLAALYELLSKLEPDPAKKKELAERAARTMQDATDELAARGVKEPVRPLRAGPDYIVVRRNVDVLALLVLKLKKSQEKTAVFAVGGSEAAFGVTIDIDDGGHILEPGSDEKPAMSCSLAVNPMDETLEGLPSKVHPNVAKAIEEYNQKKRRTSGFVNSSKKPKRDDRPTMKIDPAAGDGQIGKMARLLAIDDMNAEGALGMWKTARVQDSLGQVNYILLEMKGTAYFETLTRYVADASYVADPYRTTLVSMLELAKDTPPEMSVFDDYIDGFFGFARPEAGKQGIIGLYKDFEDDPIAQLHEIFEHLVRAGSMRLEFRAPVARFLKRSGLYRLAERTGLMRGEIRVYDSNGRGLGRLDLKGEALSIALKNPAILHNLIRAMQREIFGAMDRDFTARIKAAQVIQDGGGAEGRKIWEKSHIKGVVPMSEGFGGRLFTIGDVHGDLEALRETLEGLGLIKRGKHKHGMDDIWTGGTAIVVQGGDVIDRGTESIESLLYLRRLQAEASAHHGRVVRLIGNHELFYLLRYDKGRWKGQIAKLKKEGYLRGFDENLWKNDKRLVEILREDVLNDKIVASYQVGGKVFVHGAVLADTLEYLAMESGEEVTQPKVFCTTVNRILKDSVKVGKFESVIFASNGFVDWHLNGIFSEYPTEMVLRRLGYPNSVVQTLSFMSVIKIIKKEAADGSEDVDKFAFDQVVFHDPRFFMGLLDIGVIRGKKTQRSLICADVGMEKSFGEGRASVLFESGGVYKMMPKIVSQEEGSDEYLASLGDFKVGLIVGTVSDAGLNKLREKTNIEWFKNLTSLSRADARITNFDVCMLPLLEHIPETILSGEDWGIFEFNEDGIGYGTAKSGEFVRFNRDGKRLMGELIRNEEEELFDEKLDYHSRMKIMFPDFPSVTDSSEAVLKRGTEMVLEAVKKGNVRPHAFVSQSELQDPDGPMAHDSVSLRVVLGLLDRVPGIFTENTKREDWYWVPRPNAVKFVNKVTGEIETVKYSYDRSINLLPETVKVKEILSLLRRTAANRAMNFLDGLAMDRGGTLNDRLRYELMRDSMESVPLSYDHPLVFEAVSGAENIGPERPIAYRFSPRELRMIYAALKAFPQKTGDRATAHSYSYRPGSPVFTSIIYYGKNGSRYRHPSLLIPPSSLFSREQLVAAASADEIKDYLAVLENGYVDDLAYVYNLVKERARLLYDSTSESYLKMFSSYSWETEAWDGYKTCRKQAEAEFRPKDHFLFHRVALEDNSHEDFAQHAAAYVLFGPQFRKAAERSKTLSAKYEFLKESIFKGVEYEANYDFREVAFGILFNTGKGPGGDGAPVKGDNAPDMGGGRIPHAERNKQLAALIESGKVYKVTCDRVVPEKFLRKERHPLLERAWQRLMSAVESVRFAFGGQIIKSTVYGRLTGIRKSGLIAKAAFDGSLDVGALAASLNVPEDAVREGAASAALGLDVLIVKDRLSLHENGPLAHARRGVTYGQGGAAIWLGQKLFTLKDIKDEDIARLLVEEALHFLYPDAGHDVIKHSGELSSKLRSISNKIGERPGDDYCEADMADRPGSQSMRVVHEEYPGSAARDNIRAKYDLPASMTGVSGLNLIDLIEMTLDEQFGGKRSYMIAPFGSVAYLRDGEGRIAWEYLNDIDVQVLFFEDMGIAKRREAGMGGGLSAGFHRLLAENLKKLGARPEFSQMLDLSFEDEVATTDAFNAYFDDVMPYMAEAFGERKALETFRDYLVKYRTGINLYDRYDGLWASLSEEGLAPEKALKRAIAMAAIRGDEKAVKELMEALKAPGPQTGAMIARALVSPDRAGTKGFFENRIPEYGSKLIGNIDASLATRQEKPERTLKSKPPRGEGVTGSKAIERELRAGSVASRQLFRVAEKYISTAAAEGSATGRVQPVDILVDLSLMSKEDITENMTTWAQLVLMCREMKNVNFIFEVPISSKRGEGALEEAVRRDENNAPSCEDAVSILASKIRSSILSIDTSYDAEKFIKERINAGRRDGAIEVAIMSKKRLQLLRSTGEGIRTNQYPVALDGISRDSSGKIALRHFESALTIGLAEAALAIAAKNAESSGGEAVSEKEDLKKKILGKLEKVYAVFREDIRLTEKTLDNMVSPYAEVRANLAISLALPPMTRMIYQKLIELHNGLHLFLQAA